MEVKEILDKISQVHKEIYDYIVNTEHWIFYWIAWLEKQGESNLIEEIKRREELLLREKEKAVSLDENLSLGGRIAILEELLAFTKEKQGEQKPVVPKFKVGDIVKDTEGGEIFTIRTVTKDKYIYTDDSFDWIKDQDIYELVEQKPADKVEPKFKVGNTIKYVGKRKELAADKYTIKEICNDCYITTCGSKIPFRMQEYYVIVNDAKGLKKIETSLPSFDEQQGTPVIVHNKEHCQNTAWSEEDENNLTDTCIAIRKFYREINGAQELIDWLKSLKERVVWKPSDKQIRALRWVLNNIPYNKHKEEISGLLEQIKDL